MRQQRLLAPAGNNAFEFYLKVLEKEPGNQAAQDALRETFPFGANAAEQEINAGNFDEAQREIDILAKADSSNYTLTILRSKLDAQRKLADRAEEQQKKQDELAAQKAATTSTAAAQQPEAPPPVVQTAPQQQQAAEAPKPTPPPVRTQAPAPQPEPVVKTTPAELVTTVNPRYPPQAFRRRQQGWVQVEFTVDTNGDVTNAHVVGTQGSNLFEHAALEAVERWKFRPATSNGQPVTSVLTRRIEFKL
jgi:protein TonB